jgi:hypothetical protein
VISRAARCSTVIILAILALPFVSTADTNFCTPLTQTQLKRNQSKADIAAQYAVYAILSNDAYSSSHVQLPLPQGWKENTNFRVPTDPKTGYAQAVYERYQDDKLVEVVLSFRGTDNKKDWITSLEPLHRIQVPEAEVNYNKVLNKYKDTGAKITVTGHSLGGGLAMYISFHYQGADAIVFNASPVAKPGLKPIRTNKRISISESGEILEAPRDAVIAKWVNTKSIKFRFLHGAPISQHDMSKLAFNLVRLGAIKSKELAAYIASQCPDNKNVESE